MKRRLILTLALLLTLTTTAFGFDPALPPDVSDWNNPNSNCMAGETVRQFRIDGNVIVGYDLDCDSKTDFGILYELRFDENNPYRMYYAPLEKFNPEQTNNLVELYREVIVKNDGQSMIYDNDVRMLVPASTREV